MESELSRSDPLVRWFAWVLRHRAAVLGVVAAITVASVLILTRVTVGSTLKKLFFGESPVYAEYVEQTRRFGSDEHVMLGFEVADPAAESLVEKLAALDTEAEAMRGFSGATSVGTAQVILGADGVLTVVPWAEARRAGAPEAAADVEGVLVGRDGKSVSVLVDVEVNPDRTAKEGLENLARLDDALHRLGLDETTVHRAGFPVLLVEMFDLAWDNLTVLLPMSGTALLFIVMAVFRRLLPAVVSLGIAGLAMVWTMAVSALIDPVFTIMVTAVPLVVVVVGFSDVIHLWSAWEQERLSGRSREDAILASAADVGRACLLTSITTFVGFISLAFVPTPMFRQMGVSLGVGVALALVLAMTLVPILLSYGLDDAAIEARTKAPGTSPWARLVDGLDHGLDRIVSGFAAVSLARPRAVVAVFFVLLGLAGVGASQMTIDADLVGRVHKDHPLQVDARWFSEQFTGDNMMQVFFEGPEDDAFLDPERLAAVARFQAAVGELPEVQHTISLVDALRRMHKALGAGDGTTLPDTSAAVAQEVLLFEMSGGENLERMVDFERRRLHMGVRLEDAGLRATRDTARKIEALGAELLPPDITVDATGLRVLMGAWIDKIIDGQARGVGFSVAVVTILMVVGLRSVRLGVVSMVPNLLPLLWLGGVLGVSWDVVDTDTAVIAMLAIGIGVDDTIHFLMRYRVEAARAPSRKHAIDRTFRFAGRAILMTTVVLVVGFLPCATTDYFSLWILGTLLPMVLVFAVLADLLLVPAMVQLGWLALDRAEDA